MAWTTPRTWVVGEMATAALLNTYARDNFNAIRDQASCRIRKNATAVSLATATETKVNFDTTDFDTLGTMADLVNMRINFTQAGKYLLGGAVAYAANATGIRRATIFYHDTVANTDTAIIGTIDEGISTTFNVVTCAGAFDCKSGDYIELRAYQDSGGALNYTIQGIYAPVLWAAREGI